MTVVYFTCHNDKTKEKEPPAFEADDGVTVPSNRVTMSRPDTVFQSIGTLGCRRRRFKRDYGLGNEGVPIWALNRFWGVSEASVSIRKSARYLTPYILIFSYQSSLDIAGHQRDGRNSHLQMRGFRFLLQPW